MTDGQTELHQQLDLDAQAAADRRYARAARELEQRRGPLWAVALCVPLWAVALCVVLVLSWVVLLLWADSSRGAGARAATPCTITVWRMAGPVSRIEARDWPTIQPQVGGGVRITFEGPHGPEEIGGMVVYQVSPRVSQ